MSLSSLDSVTKIDFGLLFLGLSVQHNSLISLQELYFL